MGYSGFQGFVVLSLFMSSEFYCISCISHLEMTVKNNFLSRNLLDYRGCVGCVGICIGILIFPSVLYCI